MKQLSLLIAIVALLFADSAFSFLPPQSSDSLSEKKSGKSDNHCIGNDHLADFIIEKIRSNIYRYTWKNTEENGADDIFDGDSLIARSDTVHGSLRIRNGSLIIEGVVDGDAEAVNGNVIIRSGGVVTGDAAAINGKVERTEEGFVRGAIKESHGGLSASKNKWGVQFPVADRRERWLGEEMAGDGLLFRYNRVEGVFLGIASPKKIYWGGEKQYTGFGSAGYGFASHRWRINLGIDRQFGDDGIVYEFGIEGHSLTDSKNQWIMPLAENNAVAFLWHEDYRDYFEREGASLHLARYSKEGSMMTQFRVDGLLDRYLSLYSGTNWSLFRQGREFRDNPLISEGLIRSITLTGAAADVEKKEGRNKGWELFAKVEKAGDFLKGDYSFLQAVIDGRFYLPLSRHDAVNFRMRAGSLSGDNTVQKNFDLGGANTMPAFYLKEFSGNRMVLCNIEYSLSGSVLNDFALWPQHLMIITFADFGAVKVVPAGLSIVDGMDRFGDNSLHSDVGFAFGSRDGGMRLGFAWRTDVSAPVSVFLRFNRSW